MPPAPLKGRGGDKGGILRNFTAQMPEGCKVTSAREHVGKFLGLWKKKKTKNKLIGKMCLWVQNTTKGGRMLKNWLT